MKLSIIIPVHNNEKTIAKCVCSIVEHTYHTMSYLLIFRLFWMHLQNRFYHMS